MTDAVVSLADYDHFIALVKLRLGIDLGSGKAYLLQSRLQAIASTEGYRDVDALLHAIRIAPEPRFVDAAVDALTTNETLFFRDQVPFDQLKTLLAQIAAERPKIPIRIWCAACSTGQEPYSIAMLVEEESSRLQGARVEIVATDVSPKCLEKARTGIYSQFEAQRGLTIQRLMRHFDQGPAGWTLKPALRAAVTWKRLNLLDDLRTMGQFDIVFCRNVLIYFERSRKQDVLSRVANQMREGGTLFLGAAETTFGLCAAFAAAGGAHGAHIKQAHVGSFPAVASAR